MFDIRSRNGGYTKISKSKIFAIITCFFAVVFNNSTFAATENLNEVYLRRERQISASWGYRFLEDQGNHYIWQPETLFYQDSTSGREVWRVTSTNGAANFLPDIGFSQWSADGKRFSFRSTRKTGAFKSEHETWMVQRADGFYLRPMPGAPARVNSHAPYMHWNPSLPDVYYEFGRHAAGQWGLNGYDLYKVEVQDFTETKKILISFPKTHGELGLKKAISADGTRVVATNYLYESWWFPATVFPEDKIGVDTHGLTPVALI